MTDKNAKTNSLESAAGIKLGRLNNVLIGVALLISVALLYSMHLSIQGYHRLTAITERYIACQKDAQHDSHNGRFEIHVQDTGSQCPCPGACAWKRTGTLYGSRRTIIWKHPDRPQPMPQI